MAAPHETGQGHELSDLAPIVVRCPSPFRTTGRSTALARPLPPIPELPGSPVPATSSSSSSSSVLPSSSSSPAPSPEPTPSTCHVCQAHKDPGSLLRGDPLDPRFPFAARCLDCAAAEGLDVGRLYELVSGEELWVCRWCGGAVPLEPEWDGVEFHEGGCGGRYARAVRDYWWTLAVQWLVFLTLGAVCFVCFWMVEGIKEEYFILFLATCFASVFGIYRYRGRKLYQLPLLMEVNRLLALVGMMYYVVRTTLLTSNNSVDGASPEDDSVDEASEDSGLQVSSYGAAGAILLIAWLLFHAFFSCIGHTIVFYEWRMWRRSRPGMSFWRRVVGWFMFKMVVWADPFAIELGFAPRWWRELWRWVRGLRRAFRERRQGLPR
ncbi:hypothetical protein CCMA1212_009477 [Trichoderma ghanense]|uniref:Ima1 N-terminal domain-containing protein n=1 Tax=Trichoderma ghanense TaxID=65468 RepID=A0ABY2GSW7_9HYPO